MTIWQNDEGGTREREGGRRFRGQKEIQRPRKNANCPNAREREGGMKGGRNETAGICKEIEAGLQRVELISSCGNTFSVVGGVL